MTAFPWLFTVYVIVFSIIILYYLLFHPHIRATFISIPIQKLIQWYIHDDSDDSRSENDRTVQEFSIGGIGFALLSGTIYINNIIYRTPNVSIHIIQCTIRWNWFFKQVKSPATRFNEALPSRLSIECIGLQCILYNNISVY